MATEKQMTYSKATYKKVCESLDNLGWTYDRDEEGLNIFTGASGVDLNISLRICIEPPEISIYRVCIIGNLLFISI